MQYLPAKILRNLSTRSFSVYGCLPCASFARYPSIHLIPYLQSNGNQLSSSSVRRMSNDANGPPPSEPTESVLKKALRNEVSYAHIFNRIIAGVGIAIACGSVVGLYLWNQQTTDVHKIISNIVEKSDFQKFLEKRKIFLATKDGHGSAIFIERPLIVKQLKEDILGCTDADLIVNIIASEDIGKSTMVKMAAKQIAKDGEYEVFYVNAEHTLKRYFSKCGIQFDDEMSAAIGLIRFIVQYAKLKEIEDRSIIVIIDSPGGIKVKNDANRNEQIRDSFVRGLRGWLNNYRIHIYSVSSPSNDFFTKDVKDVLCEDRLDEISQEEWIDFQLLDAEMDDLIAKFENRQMNFKFSEEEKKQLKSSKGPVYIGSFRKKMKIIKNTLKYQ